MRSAREGSAIAIGSAGVGRASRRFQRGASGSLQVRAFNPGELRLSQEGVARNVAESLARLGADTILIFAGGQDEQELRWNVRQMRGQDARIGYIDCEVALESEEWKSRRLWRGWNVRQVRERVARFRCSDGRDTVAAEERKSLSFWRGG